MTVYEHANRALFLRAWYAAGACPMGYTYGGKPAHRQAGFVAMDALIAEPEMLP
jgi:hypothetical protein